MDGWRDGWLDERMDGWLNEVRMTEWKWMYHWRSNLIFCMRGSEIYFRVSFSLAQLSHNKFQSYGSCISYTYNVCSSQWPDGQVFTCFNDSYENCLLSLLAHYKLQQVFISNTDI